MQQGKQNSSTPATAPMLQGSRMGRSVLLVLSALLCISRTACA